MPRYFINPDSFTATLSSDGDFSYAMEFEWDNQSKVVSYYDPDPPPSPPGENVYNQWSARHFSTSSSRIGGYVAREENYRVVDFGRVVIYRVQVPVPYDISDGDDTFVKNWFDEWWWNDINRNNTDAFLQEINMSSEFTEAVVFVGTQTKRYLQLILAEVVTDALDASIDEIEHYPTGVIPSGPVAPRKPVVTASVTITKDLELSSRLNWVWTDETWMDRLIGFEVQRATDSIDEIDYSQIGETIGNDIRTFVDEDLIFNERHNYNYRVRVLTDFGVNSPWGIVETSGGIDTPPLTGIRIFYGLGNASMRTKTGPLDNQEYKFLKYSQVGEIDGLGVTAEIEGRYEDPFPPAADQILAINYESQEPLVFGPLAIGNMQMTTGVTQSQGLDFNHPSLTALGGVGDYAIVSSSNDYDYDEYDPMIPNDRWLDWRFPAVLPMLLL